MDYFPELRFLRRSLSNCRLHTMILSQNGRFDRQMDLGLRSLIGWEQDYAETLAEPMTRMAHNTVYRMHDSFSCSYIFFLLPNHKPDTLLWIGPYMTVPLTHAQLLDATERYNVPSHRLTQLARLFSEIPVIPDNSPIFSMLHAFFELIWGSDRNYTIADITRDQTDKFTPLPEKQSGPDDGDIMWNMRAMEQRYLRENELLQAVAQGLSHKGEVMLSHFSHLAFEQRTPDALRNVKNYCIIMNTLLRKAAEQGGVHPLYLDRTSSEFARRIEQMTSVNAVTDMMNEMYYSYCRLVNRHSIRQYSLPIRRVITYIDSDLTADLSLKALAASQNISPGYLSTLFKKETGVTVTEFVNRRRVRQAIRLLNSGHLQVQTIARLCGIPDVNYFSKVFKKQTGKSPQEYRKTRKIE